MKALIFMGNEDKKGLKMDESDTRWYADLYARYMKPVYRYVWRRVGRSKEVAEDVVQETFLKVWRFLPFLAKKSITSPAYFYRVAHNLVVSYYRKAKPLPLEEAADVPAYIDTSELVGTTLDIEKLWEKALQLPETEYKTFALRYREGFSIKQIAKEMNKSENAVKIILSRTRKDLSKKMGGK